MITKMLELMGMMLLLMLTGALLRKREIITKEGKKCLTDLILYVILPCNIIKAFSIELEADFWQKCSLALVVSIVIQLFYLVVNRLCYGMMEDGEKQVYQYATVCSNAGFMGNPLSQGVFGDLGLLYASIFMIPQRVVMWSAGISYFSQETDRKSIVKKVLTHPCMVAVYIGLVLLITQLSFPPVIQNTIVSLSNCCTAMTMLYIGTILSDVDFRSLLSKKQLYFAFLRLILLPLIVYLVCMVLHIDKLVTGVSVFLTGMPAGSTTSLLAAKYGADEESAAKCVVLTTALSIVTLSVWSIILVSWIV